MFVRVLRSLQKSTVRNNDTKEYTLWCAFLFTNIKMYVKFKLARYYGELKHIGFINPCN